MGNIFCLVLDKRNDTSTNGDQRSTTRKLAKASTPQQSQSLVAVTSHGQDGKRSTAAQPVNDVNDTSRPSGPAHMTITSNSLLPPAPVMTDSVVLQSLELMMEDVQLLSEIGSGGSAVVYRGVYQGGDVAVKLLVAQGSIGNAGLREALVSPQLRHPHVVQTYVTRGALLAKEYIDMVCGRTEVAPAWLRHLPALPSLPSGDGMGRPRKISHERQGWAEVLQRVGAQPDKCLFMLVQELCEQGNLAATIRKNVFTAAVRTDGSHECLVARRKLLRTAAEICRGMIYLHSVSLVHGDLKPANILLGRSRDDRRGFTAKVADFGMSHLLASNSHVDSPNWGTVAYASPESLRGTYCKNSDVYSFGMILWEMLTRQRPYEHLTPIRILVAVGVEGLRPEWPAESWPELCALGSRCLAEDPEQRPGFKQLEEQLVALEEGLRARVTWPQIPHGALVGGDGSPAATPAGGGDAGSRGTSGAPPPRLLAAPCEPRGGCGQTGGWTDAAAGRPRTPAAHRAYPPTAAVHGDGATGAATRVATAENPPLKRPRGDGLCGPQEGIPAPEAGPRAGITHTHAAAAAATGPRGDKGGAGEGVGASGGAASPKSAPGATGIATQLLTATTTTMATTTMPMMVTTAMTLTGMWTPIGTGDVVLLGCDTGSAASPWTAAAATAAAVAAAEAAGVQVGPQWDPQPLEAAVGSGAAAARAAI